MIKKLVLFGMALVTLAGIGVWASKSSEERAIRQALFAEIQPVKLTNCDFARFGDAQDGGYVICANLLANATVGYSYGISGTDNWGCTVSERLTAPVHQYDCFNTQRTSCPGGTMVFHEECVGPERRTDEGGRLFDSIQSQIVRNGDEGKRLIGKMDIEGDEWASFLSTPDSVLNQFDQLSVEFHEVNDARFAETMRKLKRVFHVANVHYNNNRCDSGAAPFPATVFEVLLVNKNLGIVDPSGSPAPGPNPLDAPNSTIMPDCQIAP